MFAFKIGQPLLKAVQSAIDFHTGLKTANQDVWDFIASPEIVLIKEQWRQLVVGETPSVEAVRLGSPLSKSAMRHVARSISLFIAAHDGRYSLLIDNLETARICHPNPFRLGIALAEAETERQANRSTAPICNLSAEDEQTLRVLSGALVEAFLTPCSVLPDLEYLGVHVVKTLDEEPGLI